jgi:hypothetical protein
MEETDHDEIFRATSIPYKSFLAGVLRSTGLQGTPLSPKQPVSRKYISSPNFHGHDIPFWKPKD